MTTRRQIVTAALMSIPAAAVSGVAAQAPSQAAAPGGAPAAPLFAVEFRIGAAWDTAKPANEQKFFADHSANLKRLRDAGRLVVGARYGDKGLMIFNGSEAEVRSEIDKDPSIQAQVFTYELNAFRVHFPGCLG